MQRAVLYVLGVLLCVNLNATMLHAEASSVDENVQLLETMRKAPEPSQTTELTAEQVLYNGLRAKSATIDLSSYGIQNADIKSLYQNMPKKYPELIYVTGRFTNYYIPSTGMVTQIIPEYDDTYSVEDVETLLAVCNNIVKGIQPSMTVEEKLLYLHDYLVTHCDYDFGLTKRNAYNALVEGSAVCQGYSRAMILLGNCAGIEVQAVISQTLNHEWNMVTIDGDNYFIDCTWDDASEARREWKKRDMENSMLRTTLAR